MIKVIFFDFDGVLTPDRTGGYTTCVNINKKIGIDLDKIINCYKNFNHDLNLNKVTHKDIWNGFCQCLGKEINIEILNEAFLNTPINQHMFDLTKKLRRKYKIGIITDNNQERFNLLVKKIKLNELFDSLTLSANVGGMKNGKLIFEEALKSLNVNPEECIFIDNTQKNLDVPKEMGFKTIHYDHEKNDISLLIKELKNLGIII